MIFAKQYPEYTLLYTITHMAHGSIIYILPGLLPRLFLIWYGISYQFFQYIMGIRVYIPRREIVGGHTLKHLINKLSEHVLGFLVTMLIWACLEKIGVFTGGSTLIASSPHHLA